jgi:AcrR family transcriptional regulator
MDKKLLQKRRMMSYFIEAARQIIEKEGINAINIRDVANLAGYNSATLYNYFNDIDDLIFFASLGYLEDYIKDLDLYVKDSKNALDKFFAIMK